MTTISSTRNPALKMLRRLRSKRGRAQSSRFFAEGEDLIAAAAAAGREPVDGFRLPGGELGAPRFHEVEPVTLAAVSMLGSGTRAIGIYEQRWLPAPVGPLCVYLHGVSDPGNVGTVLRGALAFGASCVALGPGNADPHSPKAVRASMGAIFAVDIARVTDAHELPGERVALIPGAGEPLYTIFPKLGGTDAITLLIGAEREGLPREVIDACERVAHIPAAAESLNAAMAATVALYELARARGCASVSSGEQPSRVTAS